MRSEYSIKGSGKVISQAREVPSFEHIRAAGELKIVVIVGKLQKVVVKTNDNIKPYIVTSVKDDTLEI
ncbi:GIN domain-containing protein [Candidatus Coxiella mudrowiae]|uniref:GIN domain-containing protein n=1 Tax=Candidatus Coxiella mudrowiae TaxID=2054173 RepID=UPI001FD0BE5A|nr:DUF2807 domain-containing protein [Candidatus Coxiella mudrowiae]